jgi:hypothetical protein
MWGRGAGGFLNNNHIGEKPPAAPRRFDKAHAVAFGKDGEYHCRRCRWGAQAKGEREGWAMGKRVRVESVTDAYSNINTNTDANTNANPNTNTNSADAVKDTALRDKDEERRQLEANRSRWRSSAVGLGGVVLVRTVVV